MSAGKLEEIFQRLLHNSEENDLEGESDISRIIIPFSTIFKPYQPVDIYTGEEKIPFKNREAEYKMILRQEFKEI